MMRDILQGAGYALVIIGLISSRWVHAFADPVMARILLGNSGAAAGLAVVDAGQPMRCYVDCYGAVCFWGAVINDRS